MKRIRCLSLEGITSHGIYGQLNGIMMMDYSRNHIDKVEVHVVGNKTMEGAHSVRVFAGYFRCGAWSILEYVFPFPFF